MSETWSEQIENESVDTVLMVFSFFTSEHVPLYTFNKHYSIADCFSGKTEDVRLHGVFRLRLVFILKFELKRETILQ